MTRRRWIAENWDEATATLTGAQAAHMMRVLRAQPGVEADVVAGGHVFHAVVAGISDDGRGAAEVSFNLLAEVEAEPAMPVTLVMSVYKFDHMEWAIEKATELGVAAIAPVIARRTEKHLAQAAEKRAERWRRIALEAAQQSRRSDVPVVHDPVKLSAHVKIESNLKRIVLAEQERSTTLRGPSRKPLRRQAPRCRHWRLRSGPRADGLRRKRRSSMRMGGTRCRWGRAFCARRRRRLRLWRWWRRCLSR